jgi:aspartyl-tRNA(Asn)/glutamyl-tRNA(Gln) amidotransferase subunit B
MVNKKAIELAVRMGLACNGTIQEKSFFARKNYFYPDLPKGYQISQHTIPIVIGGTIHVEAENSISNIRLNRIHLEEDAGKSLHDQHEKYSAIDLNRAGTPLIEIVTEPDIRSADQAAAFLTGIRQLVRYIGVCDGNMEQGSLRCDANISARKKGDQKLGTKVEIKNLNSIKNLKKAIEFESERLISLLEKGESIIQQTRSFDANTGTTDAMRTKENADDYRYFDDPDLSPIVLTEQFISSVKTEMPLLPKERYQLFKTKYSLSDYDALQLTGDADTANYYESVCSHSTSYKSIANWLLGPVRAWLNENEDSLFPIEALQLSNLILLVDSGKVSFSAGSTKLFPALISNPSANPEKLAEEMQLIQESDSASLEPIIDAVLLALADKVAEYKKGKKGLLSLFVGEVMKRSKGKADPKKTNDIILEKLKS